MLLNDIEEMLEENGYSYCEYSGCFDIAARRESIMLLKVLGNVDSFQEEQANNLKTLSNDLDAKPILVGVNTRREVLSDNIIYDRFDIPTVSPRTLENIIHGTLPTIFRFRGGMFVEIDPAGLKKAREESGFSQSQLAEKIGITKKSIYEHESKKLKIVYKNAVRIEKALKTNLMMPLELKTPYAAKIKPRSIFEGKISQNFRRMGFATDFVYQSPFNMIAKERSFMLISDVDEKKNRIQKNLPYISEFSKITRKSAVVITNEEINCDIPTLKEDELPGLKSKDIRKLIKRW